MLYYLMLHYRYVRLFIIELVIIELDPVKVLVVAKFNGAVI